MKVLALLCSLFAIVSASSKPTFVAKTRALDIRGGAAIGPLDEELAVQLVKAGATAYIAGAGSKFVADKTGASGSQVCSMLLFLALAFFFTFLLVRRYLLFANLTLLFLDSIGYRIHLSITARRFRHYRPLCSQCPMRRLRRWHVRSW